MARFAVITMRPSPTQSPNWWRIRPISCASNRPKRQFVKQNGQSQLSIVLKPADNLVIVDHAGGAESLIVMQIGHARHGDGLAHDRAIDMSVRSDPVDGDIVSRSIDRCGNLAVAT